MTLQPGPDDRGLRLDVYLARCIGNLTRSQIQLLNRSGAIRIEGRRDKAGYRIRGGERIEVDLRVLERSHLTPEQIPLQIYFEDQDLAVIEKPAGLVVHPGSTVKDGTVVHALLFHFQNLSDVAGARSRSPAPGGGVDRAFSEPSSHYPDENGGRQGERPPCTE